MERSIRVLDDPEALALAGAQRWVTLARAAIAARGAFHVVLAGGSTPRRLYQRLAEPERARRVDWSRVHVYFGDERCVPPDHADSNYRMAREALLDHVPLAAERVHRLHGEADPAQAAADYGEWLRRPPLPQHDGWPVLDLVMLGLGTDGHTASLFPGTTALAERAAPATAVYVEKLDAWRLTLTLPVLNAARHVLFLVAGADKAPVVPQALLPDQEPEVPAARVRPAGCLEWYLDRAAAEQVPDAYREPA